jgi:hypothetical protein
MLLPDTDIVRLDLGSVQSLSNAKLPRWLIGPVLQESVIGTSTLQRTRLLL